MKNKPLAEAKFAICIRLAPGMKEKMEKEAKDNYRTLTGQIRMIIEKYYGEKR